MVAERAETDASEMDQQIAEIVRAVHDGDPVREVAGIDASTIDATIQQAYTFYENDRYEKAAIMAEGARALDVTRFYPHLLLGDIYMRRGDVATAEEAFERALEIRSEAPQAMLKLAETKIRLSCAEEAREILSELLAGDDLDIAHRNRARVLMERID